MFLPYTEKERRKSSWMLRKTSKMPKEIKYRCNILLMMENLGTAVFLTIPMQVRVQQILMTSNENLPH